MVRVMASIVASIRFASGRVRAQMCDRAPDVPRVKLLPMVAGIGVGMNGRMRTTDN